MNLKGTIKNLFLILCTLTSGLVYAAQREQPRRNSCPSPELFYRDHDGNRSQRITSMTAHYCSWTTAEWHAEMAQREERKRAHSAESAASPHVDRQEPSQDLAMSYAVLQVTDSPAPKKEQK